jgi:Mn-dependent DtxR family transcriptional regulator
MEEIELNILRLIHEVVRTGGRYANFHEIAQSLKIADQDILDFLDMLEAQGYVSLARYADGANARLTAPGRLLLTHPDYMVNK